MVACDGKGAWVKAAEVEGRIIHISLDITLTPKGFSGEPGGTDKAWAAGLEIVDDIMRLLQIVGVNEGFKVDVERKNVVY